MRMNVELPTAAEREAAIAGILARGLVRPVSTVVFLRDMLGRLGLRVIFRGSLPGVVLSLMVAVLYVVAVVFYERQWNGDANYYAWVFLFSPLLFVGLTLSSEITERLAGELYALKMTCRYTVRQISAFRLLCFSLAGTVFAVIGGYVFHTATEAGQLMQLLSLSLGSVFLCTLLIIFTIRRLRVGWWFGALSWMVLGFVPILLLGQQWGEILSHVPPVLALGVGFAAFVLFLREIKLITREVRYADC